MEKIKYMKLIAHRGLLNGPNKYLENQPYQIQTALGKGCDCEIDLWVFDDRLYLGHDGPQYSVTEEFIRQPGMWIHAKNLNALHWLLNTDLVYFWHQEDDFTLTSNGYIWTYPGKILTQKSIMLMPEWDDKTLSNVKDVDCYGVCTDYINLLI